VTAKADVVRWLKGSFEAAQENYPKIDKQKAVKFLGHDATCEGCCCGRWRMRMSTWDR
jgi:hypothetical protein